MRPCVAGGTTRYGSGVALFRREKRVTDQDILHLCLLPRGGGEVSRDPMRRTSAYILIIIGAMVRLKSFLGNNFSVKYCY
ncbi:hypothetical protein A3H10_00050 [Candidatus Uhrbacteria bacterium RIFCSPLOWO2_12_FULL_46_10]|uniref:Uncharacterized protein n=1 Tax=Candidatus Uhrbacteria bacterium RIFCSPLOWO2_01_FULL_47_25 TaxID=1802402 RepID=A0A1F7UTA5_9BACT|nr:MAG: hypothetical protein UX68_C0008G0016 [Parcubacteria group bacterium GW2011_GWA2_46_9]OGL60461.1 MAG: hypothetical protein A2752_05175 [Candidatus Uhrbacteria bacterium RIFCSPHIGHO2_01_FULL_46_23]OGL67850.1 MAG: hypothetical protein A3D60_01280 [Candidatus Uhrbacteria bacterium RIFCSPHIGHO2_02_FULL_47_29]OGL76531.1 MAG: hypothetical protein A3E96_00650 [Candidatus Uhrbacteria bacterium RIFCSPHIGHO2_12_FULL_46_13]OGL81533.1 MAG: hypothetical protein A2936_01690 [Candidatus Uhrbacteria bac